MSPMGSSKQSMSPAAKMTTSTVRNRTLKVGKRLEKSADVLAGRPQSEPCPETVIEPGTHARSGILK
jgi:hypothetical protein